MALALMFSFCTLAFSADDEEVSSFTLVNYNVAGLPSLKDYFGKAEIQKKLGALVKEDDFDIVCVSEDFGYDRNFAAGLDYKYRTYGTQTAAFGDGLNIFSKTPIYNPVRFIWNSKGGPLYEGDIVAQKGFVGAVVKIADGVYADVYVLHADAFDGEASIGARIDNLNQVASYIESHDNGRPVIVTGDFNSSYHFAPEGTELYKLFVEGMGFKDVWNELCNDGEYFDYSNWSGEYWGYWDSVEHIFYRDGKNVDLEPVSHCFNFYKIDGVSPSDHAAASAKFNYTVTEKEDAKGLRPAWFSYTYRNIFTKIKIVIVDLIYVFSHIDELKELISMA